MRNEDIIYEFYKESIEGLNGLILNDKDLWYSYVVNLPLNLQVVYTIIIFHQQVFNGGFHQYFYNSYGQFAYLTIENLNLINAYKSSNLLSKALVLVNYEELNESDFRAKIFNREIQRLINFDDELCETLDILNNEYDEVDEDLEHLMVKYLIKM